MKFKKDPEQLYREDDAQVAWSYREFMMSEDKDPMRLIILPMAKSVL